MVPRLGIPNHGGSGSAEHGNHPHRGRGDGALRAYQIESNTSASGGQQLVVLQAGATGTASTLFQGAAGTYALVVRYFDESHGKSTYSVSLRGTVVDSWTAAETDGGYYADDQSARDAPSS